MKNIMIILCLGAYGVLYSSEATKFNEEATNALWGAVKDNSIEGVLAAIAHGADLNEKEDWYGSTVLHWAIGYDFLDIAQKLIEFGADLNARNDEGESPLFSAVYRNNKDVVIMLLRHGADPFLRDYWNVKVSDRTRNAEIKALLKDAENKINLNNMNNLEMFLQSEQKEYIPREAKRAMTEFRFVGQDIPLPVEMLHTEVGSFLLEKK